MIFKAVLALVFVLGLLLVTLSAIKYCQVKGVKCRFMKHIVSAQRINVAEMRRIDARNTVAVIRVDDTEYSVLMGSGQSLLLGTKPVNDTLKEKING